MGATPLYLTELKFLGMLLKTVTSSFKRVPSFIEKQLGI